MNFKPFIVCLASILIVCSSQSYLIAQSSKSKKSNVQVYLDKNGVLRWTKDDKEAAFFGVNYTTPFAFAYRAHKSLGVDLEKAIQQDVYHMARLGLDAFRVHVWDNEISDVAGNLIENDHLRLYDFLLAELKKRNIKTIITPIAFWGNGYPEPDEDVPGFSRFYGRGKLTTNDSAIVAQENYLLQFFKHVNPYTRLSYQNDPDVIAVEINNEPAHSGPKKGVTDYINRLAAAIKSTGWTKPVFYNISQGPYYADAVAASVVDGYSFQWYPTGLVSGNNLKGNYLANVDKYTKPFDTIPAFRKKGLMVYEFDAADVLESYMYPAMARSFRGAGMEWATQFAYDPMAIAHVNTEYQTHYLNLAYTPSKAISLLIASKVFHKVPRFKNYGSYPADSVFDVFRVSYKESLSEMNDGKDFYYSNSTTTKPLNVGTLQHVAGVGNSSVAKYEGTGAYFLDKLEEGVWRLEVMPDAIHIRDPFERASPKKEVTRIQWQLNRMQLLFPDLGSDFGITSLNEGNSYMVNSEATGFRIQPGTYLVSRKGKDPSPEKYALSGIGLTEFVAPKSSGNELYLNHEPFKEVTAGKPITIKAKVVGLESGSASIVATRLGGRWRTIPMTSKAPNYFEAEIPAEMLTPGIINYRIVLQKGTDYAVFPGNLKANPNAWDNFQSEWWEVFVASENSSLQIFNPTTDRNFREYPVWRRGFQSSYVTGEKPGQLILRLNADNLKGVEAMGFQYSFVEKRKGRISEMGAFTKMVVRARTESTQPISATVALVNSKSQSFSSKIELNGEFRDIEIPLTNFKIGASLLMPRPYPGFLPLFFSGSGSNESLKLSEMEKIELTVASDLPAIEKEKSFSVEVEGIWFRK